MKNKRSQGILWVAAILPLIMVAAVWTRLPEQVPLNWGFDGTISYGGRAILWGLAVINPLIVLLMTFAPRMDPRKENYQKFKGPYSALCLADGCSAYDGDWQHDAQVSADVVLRYQKCLDPFQ